MVGSIPVRVIPPPKIEEPIRTKYINIKKEENTGGKEWKVKGTLFEFAVKIFKDDLGTEPANSRIKVIKRTWLDEKGESAIEEVLVDGVDSSALIKDADYFEHEYVVRVEEANVAIKGVIRVA